MKKMKTVTVDVIHKKYLSIESEREICQKEKKKKKEIDVKMKIKRIHTQNVRFKNILKSTTYTQKKRDVAATETIFQSDQVQ